MLAAGVGERLGPGEPHPPKALLRFGGHSLLARHVALLRHVGVDALVIATGYRAELIEAELAALGIDGFARTVPNPDFRSGSILSLLALEDALLSGQDLLVMDADVLYDQRLLERLLASRHRNCLLLDRVFEPGDEPVKLGVRDGAVVELARRLEGDYDERGESVGFLRLSPDMAAALAAAAARRVARGETGQWYEAAIRDLLHAGPAGSFGFEDITGLPWLEIDFPADVVRAERDILPRLASLPTATLRAAS
jgi:choline kinase